MAAVVVENLTQSNRKIAMNDRYRQLRISFRRRASRILVVRHQLREMFLWNVRGMLSLFPVLAQRRWKMKDAACAFPNQ